VCFLVGAGISVAAGVPDFRSPGDGVYSKLEEFKLPFPEAAFEINYFKGRPEVYYNVKKKFLN
jgi:NAD-dependent SIR2 family protein deacetylase